MLSQFIPEISYAERMRLEQLFLDGSTEKPHPTRYKKHAKGGEIDTFDNHHVSKPIFSGGRKKKTPVNYSGVCFF